MWEFDFMFSTYHSSLVKKIRRKYIYKQNGAIKEKKYKPHHSLNIYI